VISVSQTSNKDVATIPSVDPEALADRLSEAEIERLIADAGADADVRSLESLRQALLILELPALWAFHKALARYLDGVDRPSAWSVWIDEGICAWRLRVHLGSAGLTGSVAGITYWISEDDNGWKLLIDAEDADEPTDFARRTARVFPSDRFGLKRIEHTIAGQVTFA
jgi:hypothetical protein